MINSRKDKVTAHLEKSVISNIRLNARASLKEPSRPFTPGESQRTLFSNSDSNRPPSSYSINNLCKELEPLKQRSVIDDPIQINRKIISDSLEVLPGKPVKIFQEQMIEHFNEEEEEEDLDLNELKNSVCIIEKMRQHIEIRMLYDDNDLTVLLDILSANLSSVKHLENKPKWATCEEVLKLLALTLENFENETTKVMKIAKCLLENMIDHEILYQKLNKDILINPLAVGATKVLYQYSKRVENDTLFIKEQLFDIIYTLLLHIVSEDSYIEIDMPYEFLIFLLGTLKNITNSKDLAENVIQLIAPLASILPIPSINQNPHRNPKHSNLLVQASGILKNISSIAILQEMLDYQILERLSLTMLKYKDQEIILNCLKAISKVSLDKNASDRIKSLIFIFIAIIQEFQSPLFISRACYIIANIMTIHQNSRKLAEKSTVLLLLGISQKYLGSYEEIHIDLLVKTIRLSANLVSAEHIGSSLECANSLLNLLIEILNKYNAVNHEELILNAVACLTNLLYFDIPGGEYINQISRISAFSKLSPLLVDNFNEEIASETLRALGNLTRHESICRELPNMNMIEILLIFLGHSNITILFYDLGCLINISNLAKELLYSEKVFSSLISTVEETKIYEPELTLQLFMILCNLCTPSKRFIP